MSPLFSSYNTLCKLIQPNWTKSDPNDVSVRYLNNKQALSLIVWYDIRSE